MSSLKTQTTAAETLIAGDFLAVKRQGKWKVTSLSARRQFTLWKEKPNTWVVSGIDSAKCRRRKWIAANRIEDAIRCGAEFLCGASPSFEHPNLQLADAFDRAIRACGGSDEHKGDYRQFAEYFLRWADTQRIVYWNAIRFEHLNAYVKYCFDQKKLATKTVSRYLEPVRATSRFVAANWPEFYHDIASLLRLPRNHGRDGVYRDDRGNSYLAMPDVMMFLKWLENDEHAAILLPGVLLQGVCGLQLREALRLRWTDVDTANGTITIQSHREYGELVKNAYRSRRIPVAAIVLSRFQGMSRVGDKVIPYSADDKAYAKMLTRAMRKWDKTKAIAPKDLRNTLQTAAVDHGWNEYLIERYVGHAPRTIAKRHYYGDKGQRLIDEFRRQILPRIEALIAGAQSSPEEGNLEKGADSSGLSERMDSRNMDPVVAEVPFGAIHSEECHVARIISLSELAG